MWLVFTVIFIFGQIAFLQLFKYATKNTTSAGALAVWIELIVAVSIMIIGPVFKFAVSPDLASAFQWKWPHEWYIWVLLFVSLILYAVNDRLDATTRKNLDISTDTMIGQVYRIFFFVGGIVFLGRPFVWLKLLGALIIVIATGLLFFEKGKLKINRFVWLKVISAVVFAAALLLDLNNSQQFYLPFFVLMSFGVPAIYLLLVRQATPRSLIKEIKRKAWPIIILAGIIQGVTSLVFYLAYLANGGAHFIEVGAISSVYVVLNVFFAYFFLKEKRQLWRKIVVAVVIVASILLITFADKIMLVI